MKNITLILFILFPFVGFNQSILWQSDIEAIRSYSSVRSSDLNNDGVLDLVLGGGVDGYATPYGVIAINGDDGNILWTMPTRNEMFGSAQFLDINNDDIEDVVITGRDAELRMINGQDGSLIWEFWTDPSETDAPEDYIHPNDSGWYNFYNPQIITDLSGDGLSDLLCANGGDHSLDAIILDRPPGNLLAIDAANGDILYSAVVPDSNETYMSPLCVDLDQSGNQKIIFGTGGETIAGNLWICDLSDLVNEDLSSAIPLLNNPSLGVIAPPSIGDINNDLVKDIIVQSFDGRISAIDGSSFEILWEVSLDGVESSVSPTLGVFSGNDNNLDVFCINYVGAESSYNDFYQILIDGFTGDILFMDSIGDYNFASAVAFDSNSDGKDEVLLSTTNLNAGFNHDLFLLDFINDTTLLINNTQGGDVWSTPLIQDLDNNEFIDIVFVTQNGNPFESSGISISRISTDFSFPNQGINWGSYMGTDFNAELENYYGGCEQDLQLYLVPSISCPGENTGSINLFTPTGEGPFTYSWSNGAVTQDIDNLAVGLYTVIVADGNGCQDTASVIVEEYTTTSVVIDPLCYGSSDGSAYFTSSGCNCNSSNCQFIWSINDSIILQGDGSSSSETHKWIYDIPAGTYTSTILHPDGCIVEGEVTLNDPDPILIEPIISSVSCLDNSDGSIDLSLSGGTPEYFYLWDNGETGQSIDDLSVGNYQVIISDDNFCLDTLDISVGYDDIFNVDTIATCDSTIVLTAVESDTYLWNTDEITQEIIVSESGYYSIETNSQYFNVNNAYSMSFDGVDDYVNLGNQLDISGDFTIEAYIQSSNSTNVQTIFCKSDETGSSNGSVAGYMLEIGGGILKFGYRLNNQVNWNSINATTTINNNQWYNVVVTRANNDIKLFIDGVSVGSGTFSGNITFPSLVNTYIGKWWNGGGSLNNGYLYEGLIDRVSLWNIALDSVQINEYMNCPPIGNEAGVVGYWNFDEGSGTTVLDLSENENHGIINGATYDSNVFNYTCESACLLADSVYVNIAEPIVVDLVTNNPTCYGYDDGNATVSIINGENPENYIINWFDNNPYSLLAGDYSFEITDLNNCSLINQFTLEEPPFPVELSIDSIIAPCNSNICDGYVVLSATGTTGDYNFNYAGFGNTYCPGNYTVSVWDSNGCFDYESFEMPGHFEVEILIDSILCYGDNNGVIEVQPTLGSPPYSYNWSNGETTNIISDISAGSYVLNIVDLGGCSEELYFDLLDPEEILNITIEEECDSFNWNGEIYIESSVYEYINISSSGCDSTVVLDLTINQSPSVNINYNDNSLYASTDVANDVYWNTGETSSSILPQENGTYWVLVNSPSGCFSDTMYFVVDDIFDESWNCIENSCVDPEDGTGLYSNISDCEIDCHASYIMDDLNGINKKLKKITNVLGQEIPVRNNTSMFYIYDDGSVEKKIIIE